MRHELYASSVEMLVPEVLSALEGRRVTHVRSRPFEPASSASGSRFRFVETDGEQGRRYVLKRVSAEWDWIMRATDDWHGREAMLWQQGVLDRLPPEIAHPVLACAEDGLGWAILMRDVSETLMNPTSPVSVDDNELLLDAMAALHAAFWDEPNVVETVSSLCRSQHFYTALSPATAAREASDPAADTEWIQQGWDLLEEFVAADVAAIVRALLEDPRRLCAALARYPHTLVHGDWRPPNRGILRATPPRTVLLDWHFATLAPPAADLAWYLGADAELLPIAHDAAVARYRDSLQRRLGARFADDWWRPQLELSLLGGFVRQGCAILLHSTDHPDPAARVFLRDSLRWWSAQVRSGARWL
jgi:hypothetical protein